MLSTENGVARERPRHHENEQESQQEAEQGREHDRGTGLGEPRPDDRAAASLCQAGAHEAADQGVRAARWDAERPGDEIPGDRACERAEDHPRIDDARGDDPGTERLSHLQAEEQKGDEVEEGRPGHRVMRPQHARGDDRRDRVGGIVHAVEKIEQEVDGDQADQRGQGQGRVHKRGSADPQTCSITRPVISFPMSSKRSATFSR